MSILSYANIFAQSLKITGRLTSIEKNPIANSNVLIKKFRDGIAVGFAISDNDGYFSIDNLSLSDSLYIKVMNLNYTDTILLIKKEQQHYDIILTKKPKELEVVTVKSSTNPIIISGYTIMYKTKAFANNNDRVLADVLKNIPGITVSDNGKIKFNGRAISDLYIDGKNMLDDNYQLATNNLNYGNFDEVQVLQNHKAKNIEDSVFAERTTAINLKLSEKAKQRLIGQVKIGAGVTPFLLDNQILGFYFGKKIQMLSGVKQNNIGQTLTADKIENAQITNQNLSTTTNFKQDVIGITSIGQLIIKTNRYNFNNDVVVFANFLKIIKPDKRATINISGFKNKKKENAQTNTIINLQNGNINFNESIDNEINENGISGKFNVEKNGQKLYYQNKLFLEGMQISKIGSVQNINLINQKLNQPFVKIANSYEAKKRVGKKLLTFNSAFNFNNNEQNLELSPGQFAIALNQNINYKLLEQDVRLKNLNFSNAISFDYTKKNFLMDWVIGQEYIDKKLVSEMNITEDVLQTKLNDSFANQIEWKRKRFYFGGLLNYKKKYATYNLSLPLDYSNVYFSNINSNTINKNYLFFNPSLNISYKKGPFGELNFSGSQKTTISDIMNQYQGFIVTDYRNMHNNDSIIQESKSRNLKLRYNFLKPISGLFGNIETSYSSTIKNTMPKYLFNGFATTVSNIVFENINEQLGLQFSLEKYYFKNKLSAKLSSGVDFETFNIIQQSNLLVNKLSKVNFGLSANLKVSSKIQLNTLVKSFFQTNSLSNIKTSSKLIINNTRLSYKITDKISLSSIQEFYFLDNKISKSQSFFSDMLLTYKNKKLDLEFEANNLTNQKEFVSNSIYSNFTSTSFVKLRPVNFVIKVYFNF